MLRVAFGQRPFGARLEGSAGAGRGPIQGQVPALLLADAAFANPEVSEFLEAEGFTYAIRLPANNVFQETLRLIDGLRPKPAPA